MLGVALMWTWAGYALAFYGFQQIRGGNDGFAMLAFPWVKWSPQPNDTGSGTGAAGGPQTNPEFPVTNPGQSANTANPAGTGPKLPNTGNPPFFNPFTGQNQPVITT